MRGQTTLDFTIGISLFIAVIVFVFAFVPGILTPFTSINEEQTVSTGAVADKLSHGALGSSQEPYVLDRECAVAFFRNSGFPADCGFTSSGPLEEQLDVGAGTNVNVSILGNTSNDAGVVDELDLMCWSVAHGNLTEMGTGSYPVEDPCGAGDVKLVRGGTPPTDNDATIAALRGVSLAGEGVTLRVVMW